MAVVILIEIHAHLCSWHVKVLSHSTSSYPGTTLNTNLYNNQHNIVTFILKCYVDDFVTKHLIENFEALYLTH